MIRHIAIHGIEEERVGVAGEHRFYIARALLGGLQIPLRRDARVGHHQLFLFIHLQQRLATQPVEQLVGIRGFQQGFQTILRLVTADTGEDGQQVEIMVAQHQSHTVAQRFDIAQDLQRPRATGHQIAGQP